MASTTIASIDRSLGRASSLISFAAFIGVTALAFLPARPILPVATALATPPTATAAPPVVHAEAAAPRAEPSATKSASDSKPPVEATPVPTTSARPEDLPTAKPAAKVPPLAAVGSPSGAKAEPPSAAAPMAERSVTAVAGVETPPAAGSPLPPDIWSPQELAAGLRRCIELLAPANVEIEVQDPVKHGACGTTAPISLRRIGDTQKVTFDPPPTTNCRLAASLSSWVDTVLQPAAREVLGSPITRIVGSGSYSCRNVYNNPKLSLSEHATGNAIDIAGFVTADGRTVMVKKTWGPTERDITTARARIAEAPTAAKKKGSKGEAAPAEPKGEKPSASPSIDAAGKKAAERRGSVQKTDFKRGVQALPAAVEEVPKPATGKEATFLKKVHAASCTVFATVLGPEANEAHRDHFHLDMKSRRSGVAVCH